MEIDPTKFIYGGMNLNQILYIRDNLGLMLNEALQEVRGINTKGAQVRKGFR